MDLLVLKPFAMLNPPSNKPEQYISPKLYNCTMIGNSLKFNLTKEMMMKKEFVAGIDISKDKLNIAIRRLDTLEVVNEFEISNSIAAIKKFFKTNIKPYKDRFLLVAEATGVYGLELANQAFKHEIDISVQNPLRIKRYSEMEMYRAKTDRFDAKIIAKFGCEKIRELKLSKPKDKLLEEVLCLLKLIDAYHLEVTSQNNRLHAARINPNTSKSVLKSLERILKYLGKEIKQLTDKCKCLVEKYDKSYFEQLKRIMGVGEKTAIMIIAFYGKFELFETAKQVVSFAGINPRPYESGTSVRKKGGISKKGKPFIRKVLYMASLAAMQYNKSCKNLYERLLAKGKSKRTGLIAVASKLLRQIFAVGKYDREWQNNYVKTDFTIDI